MAARPERKGENKMFNLLRMDLYRLKRSRSVYICFAILFVMTIICFWFVWMTATPQGDAFAAKIGIAESLREDRLSVENYDTLLMFREIAMDGGGYSVILGILVTLFVCLDFQSGFMKNIMSLQRSRWKYIISKTITAGILSGIYLILQYAFCILLNLMSRQMVPFTDFRDVLFYLANAWINTTAFSALIIMICVFARSGSAGILTALLLGSGIAQTILLGFTGLFHMTGWQYYTLYYNLVLAPSSCSGIGDLRGIVVGLVFLVFYSVIAAVSLARQDI